MATIGFTILRCGYNVHDLDIFFYPNPNNNIFENKIYLYSHIIINFMIGFLFGFQVLIGMLVKISVFEIYLYFTENCDIFKVSDISFLILIIIISLLSYTAGSLTNILFI
tara:strand:+ start:4036 stop:4365 length:330 start_codon:yes stop_codon:yes gene_type:complete